MDVFDEKMNLAKNFGATHIVNTKRDDAADEVKKLTDGKGVDYIFVTVGSVSAIKQGMSFTVPRGTTVIIGLPPVGHELCFSPLEMIRMGKPYRRFHGVHKS